MPGAIQELEKRIATEWLPTSGYEFADGPDVEVYFTPDPKQATFEVSGPCLQGNRNKIMDERPLPPVGRKQGACFFVSASRDEWKRTGYSILYI